MNWQELVNEFCGKLLTWIPCNSGSLPGSTCNESTFIVPSAYYTKSQSINISVKKFWKSSPTPSKTNVVFLAGGPGNRGLENDNLFSSILDELLPGTILYALDHRGLGNSTPLDPTNRKRWQPYLEDIERNAPFPLEHMTLTDAALDIGVLAGLIKNQDPESTISLIGASYGAHLAQHSAALLPIQFHSIFLFGTPNIFGPSEPETDSGLMENCAASEECLLLMNNNPKDIIQDFHLITNPELNDCTRMFYTGLRQPLAPAETLNEILMQLSDLLYGNSSFSNSNSYHSAQIAFAFIRSTAKCYHPSLYKYKVLEPVKSFLRTVDSVTHVEDAHENGSGFSSLVNSLILLDKMFDFDPFDNFEAPAFLEKSEGLLPHGIFGRHYWSDFNLLRGTMKRMRKSERIPLKSTVTKVFMIHGDIDLNTTKGPAKHLFNQIEAPVKRLLTYRNLGHTGLSGPCRVNVINEGLFGSASSDTDNCFAQVNSQPLDWSFSGHPNLASIWDTCRTGFPGAAIPFYRSPWFLGCIGVTLVLFFIALTLFIISWYRLWRDRTLCSVV